MSNYGKILNKISNNEAYIITSPHNLLYLTGFSGGEGLALIGKNLLYLFTDSRYIEAAGQEAAGFTVVNCSIYYSKLNEILSEHHIKNIYFEDSFISVELFENIKKSLNDEYSYTPASQSIEECRIIKNEIEIQFLKKAEEIVSNAYMQVVNKIREGMTELELCAEIEYLMKKNGAQKTSFDTIVVSGKKTSMPHGIPSDKKICIGDFITMDFGCIYNGYCSDMTRTVVLGKADSKQKEIYETVLNAQLFALDYISAGRNALMCDKIAREYIENAGYGKYFTHSLGHGVGVLIHEKPNLSPKSDVILKENMVVSCEPGIYIPDFGGVRIEDLVIVKENGIENLTSAQKEFTVI